MTQMEIAFIPQVKDLVGGFHIIRHICQAFLFFPTISDFQTVDFNKIKITILTWQENYAPQYFSKATDFLRSFLHPSDVLPIDLILTFFHYNSFLKTKKKQTNEQKTPNPKQSKGKEKKSAFHANDQLELTIVT